MRILFITKKVAISRPLFFYREVVGITVAVNYVYAPMKQASVILLLLILSFNSVAQKPVKETFFLFDSKMKGVTKIDSAAFMLCVRKMSDTLWQFDTYNAFGPLTSSEQYRDEDANIPSGTFTFYHPTGYMDSTGRVVNGRLNGDWSFYNDTGKPITQKTYVMGRLVKTRNLLQEETSRKDSTNGDASKTDSLATVTFNKVEWESEYVGGLEGWKRYLNKNLRYPERAIDNNISGKVIVQFIIDTNGKPTEVALFKSVEFSLDKEARKMILSCDKWKPALQDGRLVKSYKRQPMVFNLTEK